MVRNVIFLRILEKYSRFFPHPKPVEGKYFSNYIFFLLVFFVFTQSNCVFQKPFTIMLDPAGDAQHTGRQIDDSLERGISLQFAQSLKEKLEEELDQICVVLARVSGETLRPLQNANFANRFAVDLYLSIHFYQEKSVKPNLFLYTFSFHDDFVTRLPELFFCPYDQAHLINLVTTQGMAEKFKTYFVSDEYKKLFDVSGVFTLPFKPLIGVIAPAIAVELGLRSKDSWKQYVDLFADAIESII